jgi:TPR repeat protein
VRGVPGSHRLRCSGCRGAVYCCEDCARAHWPAHLGACGRARCARLAAYAPALAASPIGDAKAQREALLAWAWQLDAAKLASVGVSIVLGASAPSLLELLTAAFAGVAPAQMALADRLFRGQRGTRQDDDLAVFWCRKAAAQGWARAQVELGVRLCDGADGGPAAASAIDAAEAYRLYSLAAAQGEGDALFRLGLCHREGRGGAAKDISRAAQLFGAGAAAAHTEAQREFGLCLLRGKGVPQNSDEAVRQLLAAAECFDALAIAEVRKLGRKPPPQFRIDGMANRILYEALQGRSGRAWSIEGDSLTPAGRITAAMLSPLQDKLNYELAVADVGKLAAQQAAVRSWKDTPFAALNAAAVKGDGAALTAIGMRLLFGHEVPKDEARAFASFRRAARRGFAEAQFILGVEMCHGPVPGEEPNAAEGVRLLALAADQDHPGATFYLGNGYKQGSCGLPRDDECALHLFVVAARLGDPMAQYELAERYLVGRGVPRSLDDAVRLLAAAAAQGYTAAAEKLRELGVVSAAGRLAPTPEKAVAVAAARAGSGAGSSAGSGSGGGTRGRRRLPGAGRSA